MDIGKHMNLNVTTDVNKILGGKRTVKQVPMGEVYPKERILGYTVEFEKWEKPRYYVGTIVGMDDIKAEGPTKKEVMDEIRSKLKAKYPYLGR